MRFPAMARRTGTGFLLAALVGVLVGNFFMPAFGSGGIVLGVVAAMAVDVYLRNRAWRRQQREAKEDGDQAEGPATKRQEHRSRGPRDTNASSTRRRRRR